VGQGGVHGRDETARHRVEEFASFHGGSPPLDPQLGE
jgi:hypothetical protein